MLRLREGYVTFDCDGGCGETVDTRRTSITAAYRFMQASRWRIGEIEESTVHICPRCRKETRDARQAAR